MKARGILYSSEMIRAKLEGRKTMTRRIVKMQVNEEPACDWSDEWFHPEWENSKHMIPIFKDRMGSCPVEANLHLCPYGMEGDILYAREMYSPVNPSGWLYRGDCKDSSGLIWPSVANNPKEVRWKPSIHMPKSAARIIDQIVSIKVERVQEITVEDIIKEGIIATLREHEAVILLKKNWENLWISINGEGSWNANPWVWVIETKNLSITGWKGVDPAILHQIENLDIRANPDLITGIIRNKPL